MTTDLWTSRAKDQYLTITVHYVDRDWVLRCQHLGAIPVTEERATAEGKCIIVIVSVFVFVLVISANDLMFCVCVMQLLGSMSWQRWPALGLIGGNLSQL